MELELPKDFKELFKSLNANNVRYLMIGGYKSLLMRLLKVLSFCFIISFFICCSLQQTVTTNTSKNLLLSNKQTSELSKPTQLTEEYKKARREEIQKQMLNGENLHDGSIELEFIGDLNSVPALLIVLKEYPPDSNGGRACPGSHALEALEKITGKKVGIKYEQWNSWWLNYNKKTVSK